MQIRKQMQIYSWCRPNKPRWLNRIPKTVVLLIIITIISWNYKYKKKGIEITLISKISWFCLLSGTTSISC